jgi:SpoVK/Ycf46/Vps4 family AAA+-type ATPase
MLCGVSGGGKSQLAKLISKEFNLALLRLDIGALFGSYVGESEMRTREALRLAETLAPVVLWIDELDKAFTGVGAGGDNGVSARVFGHFLTWLAEKQDNVFVVTTANDFLSLLGQFPEFGRKGRFDEIFWVDLPKNQARQEIFRIYLDRHLKDGFLTVSQQDVNDLRMAIGPSNPVVGDAPAEQFLSLLSDVVVSGSLTGAEIEYAVAEALYEAYKLDQGNALQQTNSFTPSLIAQVVQRANGRALHRPGGPADGTLTNLRTAAQANNWIFV